MAPAVVLAAALLAVLAPSVHGTCPKECRCGFDTRSRKQVICDYGGLDDVIPIIPMDNDIKRLIITAPPRYPNRLSISRVFHRFAVLEELEISFSSIPAIGDRTFVGLRNLRLLNLTGNNITHLIDTNFQGLDNLRNLHLDDNRIETMPSAAFRLLPNLQVLTMARNQILTLVPRLFFGLNHLETLDLGSNPLPSLAWEVFSDIPTLKVLRLSDCRLSQLAAEVLKLLPRLEVLDMSNNRLLYFSVDDSRHITKLKTLYLHGNRIESVSASTFSGLDLRVLTLASNRIVHLNRDSFLNVTIRDLDISENAFEIDDHNLLLYIADKLQGLSIGGNRITLSTLNRILRSLPGLKSIGITNLGLKDISSDTIYLPSGLRRLNVSNNKLYQSPVDTLYRFQSSLEMLDISRNHFRGLDGRFIDMLDEMPHLRSLHMKDNPWTCDSCYIPEMLAWMNNSRYFSGSPCSRDLGSPNCLRCFAPRELRGRPIQTLKGDILPGCTEGPLDYEGGLRVSHIGLLIALAILIILAVAALLAFLLYYRRGASYYTHEEEREDDNGIYENPGVDDDNGELLEDKKTLAAKIATIQNSATINSTNHHIGGQHTYLLHGQSPEDRLTQLENSKNSTKYKC